MVSLGRGHASRWSVVAVAVLVAAVAGRAQTPQIFDAGQEREAIYPVYDGYTRNDDGSLTLSFAYFSHNSTPVEIVAGEANGFSPGPADLGQPTTFYPGHHRWQCVMVVDEAFAGDLRWTLTHAGRTSSTSDAMLQYNWEFAAADARNALRAIEDPTTVPRGVCLNRPPRVRVLGYGGRNGPFELHVGIGEPLKLFGSVRDEGLPRGGALTARWTQAEGPGVTRFDEAGAARTLAFLDTPGTYTLTLTGSDGELEATTDVTVVVAP